jgi:release factor glutamine methyltransferase
MHEMDILMSFILGKPKEFIYAHPQHQLTAKQVKQFDQLVKRRERAEPIAYLIGHKEFYGFDFRVDKRVLCPRPSTELLIELVIESCKNGPRRVPTNPLILDVGTGSGNIAITLKKLLPGAQVMASDVSAPALIVAKQNAKHLKAPVKFYKSNVLKNLPKSLHGKLDIITFNAPYLTKQEASKQNLKYEPRVALTPTGSPTSLIEQLLQQCAVFLKPNGQLYFEIGHRQAKQVTKLCLNYFPHAKVTTYQDLGGWDRVVVVQL